MKTEDPRMRFVYLFGNPCHRGGQARNDSLLTGSHHRKALPKIFPNFISETVQELSNSFAKPFTRALDGGPCSYCRIMFVLLLG